MVSDSALRRLLRSDRVVRQYGDLVRGLVVAAVVVACVLAVWFDVALARHMYRDLHMNDFGKFYYSAKAFLAGGDMYAPNAATAISVGDAGVHEFLNMNPPHFHLLILPLALLDPLPAILIWAGINAIAFVVSGRIVRRELGIRATPARVFGFVAFAILCAATTTTVATGQLTGLLMLAVTIAWQSARRGRWTRSAVVLGLAASVKPFLAIFLPYLLLTKRTNPAALFVAAALACFAIGLLVFGWGAHAAWIGALASVDWAWGSMNGSIAGILTRALTTTPGFTPLVHVPGLVAPLHAGAVVLVLAVTLFRIRRQDDGHVDRAFAGLL